MYQSKYDYFIRLILIAALAAENSYAQLKPDGSTSNTVIVQPGGHQVVQIAASQSNTGSSVNRWTSFNIDSQGVDFDNRAAQARLIVNEITGAGRTSIEGGITVLGPRANFVIANPAGIWVNGAQFNNIGSLALATGKLSVLDYEPSPGLTQRDVIIDVAGGHIEIGAKGLAGALNSLDLLARTLRVDGRIHNETTQPNSGIRVVAGATKTQIDSSVSPVDDVTTWAYTVPLQDVAAPSEKIAVDITSLGSLTAGKVSIIVTDAGAGVRNAGMLSSTVGDLHISSSGEIRYTGGIDRALESAGRTVLYSEEGVALSNLNVQSTGDVQLLAPKLNIEGVSINAGDIGHQADIVLGLPSATGTMTGPVELSGWLAADGTVKPTTIRASGGLALFAREQSAVLQAVDIETQGGITIEAKRADIKGYQNSADYIASRISSERSLFEIEANQHIAIEAATLQGAAGVVIATNELTLTAHQDNAQLVKSKLQSNGGAIEINTAKGITANGSDMVAATAILMRADGDIKIASHVNDDTENGQSIIVAAEGGIDIKTDANFTNIGALIQGNKNSTIDLYSVEPINGVRATYKNENALTIKAGGGILNKTNNTEQLGILFGVAGDIALTAQNTIENHTARIISNGALSIQSLASDFINHTEKTPGANDEQRVNSGTRDRWLGIISESTRSWSIDYGALPLNGALSYVVADKNTHIQARNIVNRGSNILVNNGSLDIEAKETFDNRALITGIVSYTEKCFIFCRRSASSSVSLTGGEINSSDRLTVNVGQQLSNIGGRLLGLNGVQIKAQQTLAQAIETYTAASVNHGWANALGRRWAALAPGDAGGTILSTQSDIHIYGDVSYVGGEIIAKGNVQIDGQQIVVRPINRASMTHSPSGWFWGW